MVVLTGGVEDCDAIDLEMSVWLRIRGDETFHKGHMAKRKGDESLSKSILIGKGADQRISNVIYTTRLGEVVMMNGPEEGHSPSPLL
jgi:hypothetical protein